MVYRIGLDMFAEDARDLGEEYGEVGCPSGVGWGGGIESCVGAVDACAEVTGGGLRVAGCHYSAYDGDAGELCMGMCG
jgi:hypothetical protein